MNLDWNRYQNVDALLVFTRTDNMSYAHIYIIKRRGFIVDEHLFSHIDGIKEYSGDQCF